MRISITYLYTIFKYGYPPTVENDFTALSEIRKLGFHYMEMEGLGAKKLLALSKARERLRRALDQNELRVHNFCVVDPQLVSMDAAKRKQAYKTFELGAELGAYLGTETLHLASYAAPVRYLEARPYKLGEKDGYRFVNQTMIAIPKNFEWEKVWSVLVESCQRCADVAARHGKTVIMEPRVGEVICSVDSLLRLIEYVDRPNFKANFDTGHFSAQRENVVLALEKLKGKFGNIHVSDNDPMNADHLPVGDGTVDWKEFFRVLNQNGYDGYLGLDLGMSKSLIADYRKSVRRLQAIGKQLRISVEV